MDANIYKKIDRIHTEQKIHLRAQFTFLAESQTHTESVVQFLSQPSQLPSVEFPAHSSSVLLGQAPLPPSSYKSKKGAVVEVGVGAGVLRVAFANAFRPRPCRRGLRIKSESDWPILVMHIFFLVHRTQHSQWTRRADNGAAHVCARGNIWNKKDGASHLISALRAPMTLSIMCACAFLYLYVRGRRLCPDMIPGKRARRESTTLLSPQSASSLITHVAPSPRTENYLPTAQVLDKYIYVYSRGVREEKMKVSRKRHREREIKIGNNQIK